MIWLIVLGWQVARKVQTENLQTHRNASVVQNHAILWKSLYGNSRAWLRFLATTFSDPKIWPMPVWCTSPQKRSADRRRSKHLGCEFMAKLRCSAKKYLVGGAITHLEIWWSSSMGRITSHIWNGQKHMFQTTNQIHSSAGFLMVGWSSENPHCSCAKLAQETFGDGTTLKPLLGSQVLAYVCLVSICIYRSYKITGCSICLVSICINHLTIVGRKKHPIPISSFN